MEEIRQATVCAGQPVSHACNYGVGFPLDCFRTSSEAASTLPGSSGHAVAMKTYPADHWKALGQWVATARLQAGFGDTKKWSAEAGRSTRMLLGLERGEPVGAKTIEAVAETLGVASWALFGILDTGEPIDTWSEAKSKADEERRQAEADRRAMERPEPSVFVTNPDADEGKEFVTWGHMEERLSELEERIERLERSFLRSTRATKLEGGDEGDAGGTPATRKPDSGPDKPSSSGLSVLPTAASKIKEPSVNKRRRNQDESAEASQDDGDFEPR